ncbi:MAG: beta-ketoacyl synthase N-terminal-like domain-containing protein, partial [Candidatus Omnitrophota bacterium]
MLNKRIVVTGIGVISSIGIGKEEFWNNLIKGKSGISQITSLDTSGYPTHNGGEVKNFKPELYIDKRKIKILGRASLLAISCAKIALSDAKLGLEDLDRERTGVLLGTTMGESQVLEVLNEAWVKKGEQAIDPKLISRCPANVLSSNVAIELKLKGPNYIITTACAAGNYAIGYACDLI